jgi:O-antigen ligase
MNLKIRTLSEWEHLQIGILLFPTIPLLGVINVLIATFKIWRSHYQEIIRNSINRIWGIFGLCLILNCLFAYNLSEAIGGLFNFLPFFGLFAAINIFITTPNQLYQIAKITLIGGVPMHLLGLAQTLFGFQFKLNLLITNINLDKYDGSRINSLFDNPNIFGFYAAMTLIMTFIVWDALIRQLEMPKASFKVSFQYLFDRFLKTTWGRDFSLVTGYLILNTINIVMAQSRAILILSCFIFIGYFIHRSSRWASGFTGAFTIGILLAGYVNSRASQIVLKILPEVFWKRLQDPYAKDFPEAAGRPAIWRIASNLTQERPLTGWGLRNFSILFKERMNLWVGHQHNLVLMLSSEVGIPLTVFFVVIIVLLFQQSLSILFQNRLCPPTDVHPMPVQHNANTTYYFYLVFFGMWVILNTIDITLFNLTLNTFSWLIFGAMSGVAGSFGDDRSPSWIQRLHTRISFL